MSLMEEHYLVQKSAQQLAQQYISPHADRWAQNKTFPKEAIQALAEAGFMGILVPEQWDGAGCDLRSYVLVMEEIAKADGATATIVGVHNSVGCLPILNFGTAQQKENYLKPMARGELLGAFCLTEPQAGSDAKNLQTKATQEGDFFMLNGVKQFVTSGDVADLAIVFAVTGKHQDKKEISAFIVPTKTPGFEVAKVENKMGQEASHIAQIVFNNLKLSKDHLLGQLGEGMKIALSTLECGRLGVSAQAIGLAQRALTLSIQYAQERQSFGKKLCEHQAIQFKLAEMATELEAARQLMHYTADKRDRGEPALKEAAMAKLFATETGEKVCREALQIFGGYGYLRDFPIERIYRDVRVTTIYEGSSEIQKMIIGRDLTK